MVLKEKRFTPPKRHHMQGDPRRTWPSLERLIAEQEAHYHASAETASDEQPQWADYNTVRPFYRADELVEPIDETIAEYEFPDSDPPPLDPSNVQRPVKLPDTSLPEVKLRHQPPRDWNTQYEANQRRRRERPLEDPFTEQGARLYAWAYYRLQRLAVQIEKEIAAKQQKIARLQAKLNGGQREETHSQRTEETMNNTKQKNIQPQRRERPLRVNSTHAQADLGVAPGMGDAPKGLTGRETPRHAHADEGMAPTEAATEPTTQPNAAHRRRPP